MNTGETVPQLNLGKLLRMIRKRLLSLILGAILGAVLAVGASWLLIQPQYEASVMLYVQQTQSGKDLADSFEVIVKMRESLMDVISYTGMAYNHTQLQKQISVSSVNETDFFRVTVTSPDAQEAAMIANSIGVILPRQISEIMEGTTVKMVGEAIPALAPSTPDYRNNAFLGLAVGLMSSFGLALLREWLPEKKGN